MCSMKGEVGLGLAFREGRSRRGRPGRERHAGIAAERSENRPADMDGLRPPTMLKRP